MPSLPRGAVARTQRADAGRVSFLRMIDPRPLPGTPATLQYAYTLWLLAIAAGVVETIMMVSVALADGASGGEVAGAVAMRSVIYGTLVVLVSWVRHANWARVTVTVLLGGAGMYSLLADPVRWLAAGNSISGLVADAGPFFYAQVAVRGVHVVAVIAALVLMYTRTANAHFRR